MPFSMNKKRSFQEFQDKSMVSNLSVSLKRHCSSFSSWHSIGPASENPNEEAFETDAFDEMSSLKFLKLNYEQLRGSYAKFRKALRWLCWRGSNLSCIPSDFSLERLVVLDMRYNSPKNVWNGAMLRLLFVFSFPFTFLI
ncbi:hypothetical protein NMG60_11036636 [Bertholletia excelsa]